MPKNRCKIHIISSFYYLCNWNVPLKGTEKAFRKSIQEEI